MKKAVITGITGQDGSYLAELLLHLGYEVHGLLRRSSSIARNRIDHIERFDRSGKQRLFLHYADTLDVIKISELLEETRPDEVYNLAAQSHVRVSFEQPMTTAQYTGISALALMEAVRNSAPGAKFYQASTSEMFGLEAPPQNEKTRFHPRSPYGVAKLFAHWSTINYREAHGLFASTGILFNHESPRRGQNFVTRKITTGAARISSGLEHSLTLGNLDAVRDWGYAPEYVVAMWKMLQQPDPGDFVVATGEGTTVREFLSASFASLGLDWENFVKFDDNLHRPAEVDKLIGDSGEAEKVLNWKASIKGTDLAVLMTKWDVQAIRGNSIDTIPGEFWEKAIA